MVARENGEADAGMLQNYVAADRRDSAIFAQLHDAIDAAGGGTEDFEDYHHSGDQAGVPGNLGAGNKGMSVANRVADGGKASVRAEGAAAATTKAAAQGGVDIQGDLAVVHGEPVMATGSKPSNSQRPPSASAQAQAKNWSRVMRGL